MRIGIIGAGELGEPLAEWWSQAGHDVLTSSPAEAAAFGDVVLFTPEWESAHSLVDATAGALAGKPVLDATNPVMRGGLERAVAPGLSGIETLTAWAPEAQWVKAFNTFSPSVLRRRRGRDPLLAEFICTDHRAARSAATRLIQDIGFAPFFAGGAGNACLTETGGPLQMREVDVTDATAVFARAVSASPLR
jgi:8-hydroxy-5-deazaflavin:NADPH oxidoreductase